MRRTSSAPLLRRRIDQARAPRRTTRPSPSDEDPRPRRALPMPLPRYWVCWPEPRQPGRTSTAEPSQKARFRNLHSYSLDRRPGPVIQDRLGQQGALPAAFRTNDESKAAIRRLVRIRELLGDIRPCRNDISTPYNLGATEQLDGLRFALTPQHPSLNRHGAIRVRYSPDPASGEVL